MPPAHRSYPAGAHPDGETHKMLIALYLAFFGPLILLAMLIASAFAGIVGAVIAGAIGGYGLHRVIRAIRS